VYKGYWEQPSVQNFTLVFYTEADRSDCFDNVMTPPLYPTPDAQYDVPSDPLESVAMKISYEPVTQSVQDCSGVSYRLQVSVGLEQSYNQATGGVVDNHIWGSVYRLFPTGVNPLIQTGATEPYGFDIQCNMACFYSLQDLTNQPTATVTLTFAWITRDENTNTEIVDDFIVTLTGGIDGCLTTQPVIAQDRPQAPIPVVAGTLVNVDAMPID
jgi:hypothetical protein